jgi:hypothetical protein
VPVTVKAQGSLLGVRSIELSAPASSPPRVRTHPCVLGLLLCPGTWTQTFTIAADELAEGASDVRAVAVDPLGGRSNAVVKTVRVDRAAPLLTVAGDLRGAAGGWLADRSYGVTIAARDGSSAQPRSGVRSVESLGFVEAVRDAFGSLATEHDLREVGSDVHTVHYESPPGWLTVAHDAQSYELDVSFRPAGLRTGEPSFRMADFIRLADSDHAERYRSFAATSRDGVRRGIEQLAGDMRTYAEPALSADRSFLMRLAEAQQDAVAEFGSRLSRRQDSEAAEEAMRRHDWPRIIALYSPREDLSRVERKRLELARKRLAT